MLIAFFNKYVDEDLLIKEFKFGSKILNRTPCFSYDVKLRKNKYEIVTFKKKFEDHISDLCYGMLYEIDLNKDDEFLLNMILDAYYEKNTIEVTTFSTKNFKTFVVDEISITLTNLQCNCYSAKDCERNNWIFDDRRIKINFNSRLLLNFVKI